MLADKLLELYRELKRKGLSPEQEQLILREIDMSTKFKFDPNSGVYTPDNKIYSVNDYEILQNFYGKRPDAYAMLKTLEDLLDHDKQRVNDGFKPKIKIRHIVRPGRDGKKEVIIVPDVDEEKFMHDHRPITPEGEADPMSGSGEGEEGEVIGEIPLSGQGQGEGGDGQGGQGDGEGHGTSADAYQLGKMLTERFQLPNIKPKIKKSKVVRFKYELTDKNRGEGQVVDPEDSLKNIIKTNLSLGNIPDVDNVDPTKLLVDPDDIVYWTLSREKYFEPQAMVFFLRDYSGSMTGPPTDIVLTHHLFLYSWLLYQYKEQVTSRFIVHDTSAKEVPDFDVYYRSSTGGGTTVASSFDLVNKIVAEEGLAKDYNIYVFYGTDGEDWTPQGEETINALTKMFTYVNRIGMSVIEAPYTAHGDTIVEKYIKRSGFLDAYKDLLRLDSLAQADATQERIIQGIKKLIS
jgi:uncharacterized sporulation protein YeaH/YhbH (DUF444 family)